MLLQHIPFAQLGNSTVEHRSSQELEASSSIAIPVDTIAPSTFKQCLPYPSQDSWTEDIETICAEDVVFSYNFEERTFDGRLESEIFCPVQVTICCLDA
jgi:hypothetical protein